MGADTLLVMSSCSGDEEVSAMVGLVVKDLSAEVYIELLAGFHK